MLDSIARTISQRPVMASIAMHHLCGHIVVDPEAISARRRMVKIRGGVDSSVKDSTREEVALAMPRHPTLTLEDIDGPELHLFHPPPPCQNADENAIDPKPAQSLHTIQTNASC